MLGLYTQNKSLMMASTANNNLDKLKCVLRKAHEDGLIKENIVAPFFEALRDLALNRKISVWSEFTEKQVTDMKRILQKFSDKPEEQEKIAYWFLREASKKYHFNKVQEQQCEREMKRVLNNEYQSDFVSVMV